MNNGIHSFNLLDTTMNGYGSGGGFWPRGDSNQYMFGAGIWFGAMKPHIEKIYDTIYIGGNKNISSRDTIVYEKITELTYNPSSGRSWFVPGRIEDGDTVLHDESTIKKYRLYFSTDFDSLGNVINSDDGPNWPLWKTSPNDKFGTFIYNPNERNSTYFPDGPTKLSDEDIVSVYKDTDLRYFDGGKQIRDSLGYPLKLQVEQSIYSWSSDAYKDMIIILYKFIIFSTDTLFDCVVAPVFDPDIAPLSARAALAADDRCRYYNEDTTLNLGITWTNTMGTIQKGKGFGYLGTSLLMTPAINEFGYLRKDKDFYYPNEQVNLRTFRNWDIDIDENNEECRYDFMSLPVKDGDAGPGDKRIIMSTDFFNMLPGDTASTAVLICFAHNDLNDEANGQTEDMVSLVNLVRRGWKYFYDTLTTKKGEKPPIVNNFFDFVVSPNPSQSDVEISLHPVNNDNYEIKICDLPGRPILTEKFNAGYNPQHKIDISTLPEGVYIISIKNANFVKTKLITLVK